MPDFDALLAAVMLAIVLASVLVGLGVLKVELRKPPPPRARRAPKQREKTPAEDAPGDPWAPGDDEPPF